ncbi:MAG: glycosyltransferase [Oscillospiraceae bacterium]|nr:glycosyltransferase [Oscillospiraceae bacterium]
MKRIAFFQQDLGAGGIQKSLVNLLRAWDYSRCEAELFLFEEGCFFEGGLPKELKVHVLPKPPRRLSFVPFETAKKHFHYDLSEYGEFDIAVDFNSYQLSCALAALSLNAKKRVMWIHNDVEIKLRNEWKYRVLWNCFRGKFRYYDLFVPVSEALIAPFRKASGREDAEFLIIPNYIDVKEIRLKELEPMTDPVPEESSVNFVALGRLCHQKGYDIMIDLFAEACRKRDELRLYIIGEGPDRQMLEKKAQAAAPEKIRFLGARKNPYAVMHAMDAFISTSRYEGQGMNILEAKAVGLPIYCPKHLEKYCEGFTGYDDLLEAVLRAQKAEKHPDDLLDYNERTLRAVYEL